MRERRSSAGGPSNVSASTHHDCDADQVCRPPTYAYVDPETFYPVEIHNPEFRGASSVTRFLTFEYLPRTPANLALTDIRAQHPGATVSGPVAI